ncbi:MAG TPA: 50S ribosomal protein L30 [Spirochaetia bacterium]|nr:50S ribosomal protein L30 [Spirochaetia bacterium]HUZ18677.1 50S ribosomal protein L30 [Spirochaetia bacterium]
MNKIRIRLVHSVIGQLPAHRRTVKALGLRKVNTVVEVEANPAMLGMARSIAHLVSVEEVK